MSLIAPQVYKQFLSSQPEQIGETSITSRPTSSANFYINSLDKPVGQRSGQFTIAKNQNLFSGFFNRIAVNEVVLDWGLPNVANYWGNTTFTVVISGAFAGTRTITITDGFYTIEQLLDTMLIALNLATGIPGMFKLTDIGSTQALQIDQGVSASNYVINTGALARQLFASAFIGSAPSPLFPISSPRVLGTTFIDIVSSQLTYNQDVKDATTSPLVRDVLYRWYFSYDNVPIPTDGDKFPILQGYDPFVVRRTPPVVKQIRWSPIQPIGQVSFEVYDDQGRIIDTANFPSGANFQYQVSCLLSEE